MTIYEEKTETVEKVDGASEDLDVFGYAKQIIAAKVDMKAIQDDVKVIKADAKEKGILIKEIDSVMADLLRELKKDPSEAMIEDDIRVKFEANEDVMASLSLLV